MQKLHLSLSLSQLEAKSERYTAISERARESERERTSDTLGLLAGWLLGCWLLAVVKKYVCATAEGLRRRRHLQCRKLY